MVRILAFFIIVPVLSGTTIPNTVKVGLAFLVSFLIFVSGKAGLIEYGDSAAGYIYLLLQEFMTGFILGFVVYLVFSLVLFTGQIIDFQIGFAMVRVMDPATQQQVPIVGSLYSLVFFTLLVVTGGFNAILSALFHSFEILPVGGANLIGNPYLALQIVHMMTEFIVIAVRFALPILGAKLIVDVSLGLLAKAAPQMHIFVIGMPIKLLLGLALLMVLTPTLDAMYRVVFDEAYRRLIDVIRGLRA